MIQTLIDDGYLVQTVFLSPGFAWVWDPTAGELSLSYDAAEGQHPRRGQRRGRRPDRHRHHRDVVIP